MELSTLRFRSVEALRRKAKRGELFTSVAMGYVRVGRDEIAMDPDRRVREAITLVFRKFAEYGSIRQVHLWLRQERVELPAVDYRQADRQVVWKIPAYNSLHHILTNPVYAGAYVFGRTGSRTSLDDGRKPVVHGIRRDREDWEVLIRDHHDGYITCIDYERNQQLIANNANCHGAAARGAIRKGEALLAGVAAVRTLRPQPACGLLRKARQHGTLPVRRGACEPWNRAVHLVWPIASG